MRRLGAFRAWFYRWSPVIGFLSLVFVVGTAYGFVNS